MTIKNGEVANANDILKILKGTMITNIKSLQNGDVKFSKDYFEGVGDAFTDANGRRNTVDIDNTTATFEIDRYKCYSNPSYIYVVLPSDFITLNTGSVILVTHTADISDGDNIQYKLCNATLDVDIGRSSYDNNSHSVSEDDTPHAIFFKPDGTKMYVAGTTNGKICQYNLSTAWDLGTASYVKYLSVTSQTSYPLGLFFKPDGKRMFVASDKIYQYNLSTAWDLGTASYVNSFNHNLGGNAQGIFFKSDGTKMYILYGTSIYQYSLSTAWDISTASYDNKSLDISGQDGNMCDISFNSNGTKMLLIGASNDKVYQYSLSTAWDISTASYDNKSFSVSSQETNPSGLYINPNEEKMFIVGTDNDTAYRYTLDLNPRVETINEETGYVDMGERLTFSLSNIPNCAIIKLVPSVAGGGTPSIYGYWIHKD